MIKKLSLKKILTLFLFTVSIPSLILSYDLYQNSCKGTTIQQSPIYINVGNSIYSESNNFRVLTNDFKPLTVDDKWQYFQDEEAIGIAPKTPEGNFGSMLLVKNWSIYNFILKKILFRLGTENQITGLATNIASSAEMQLIFELNNNYYTPGKRKFLNTNYLVISIPFRLQQNNEKNSRIFEFMGLSNFVQNPISNTNKMTRDIKLHHIIAHQPAFLYKGTLTYPDCFEALWIVNRDYHAISANDLNHLQLITRALRKTNDNNTRNIQNQLTTTKVYRNFKLVEDSTPKLNLLQYNSFEFIGIRIWSLMVCVLFFFLN